MDDLKKLISAYMEKFKEGLPIFGMEQDEAIQRTTSAIESNKPIKEGAEINIPKDALL